MLHYHSDNMLIETGGLDTKVCNQLGCITLVGEVLPGFLVSYDNHWLLFWVAVLAAQLNRAGCAHPPVSHMPYVAL